MIMSKLYIPEYKITFLEEVDSTNSYALNNLACLKDKSIVCTCRQTLGRGRFDRKWVYDDTKNLYMSIVLKPENTKSYPFMNLTQYLSVILCDILEKEFKLTPQIKWPNDILAAGGKISGILAETHINNNKVDGIVLGLGLNVNLKKETLDFIDQKAVSLAVLTGKTYDIEPILNKLADNFFCEYDEFVKYGFPYIKARYVSKCVFLGHNIEIKEQNTKTRYFAKNIDDDGLLIVKDKNNKESKIITGDLLC